MKRIKILPKSEYLEDAERIQKILAERGYAANLQQCEQLWSRFSESMCASWMFLPEDDHEVFSDISTYISN